VGRRLGTGRQKNNDVVAETQLLQKYKGLVFHDPDTDNGFCIYDQNMESSVKGEEMDGLCLECVQLMQ
jgi:hypothetical protein